MINQITVIRMPNGEEIALTDWSDKPMFSTTEFGSGFTDKEIYGFNYIASKQVSATANIIASFGSRTATLRDTNAPGSGEMPATQEMLGYSIQFELFQLNYIPQNAGPPVVPASFNIGSQGLPIPQAPLLAEMARRVIVSLKISKKYFPQASFGWFAQGFGPFTTASGGAAAAQRTYGNQGLPSRDAVYFQSIPYHIGGTEKFQLVYSNPVGTAVPFPADDGTLFPDIIPNGPQSAVLVNRAYLVGYRKRATA